MSQIEAAPAFPHFVSAALWNWVSNQTKQTFLFPQDVKEVFGHDEILLNFPSCLKGQLRVYKLDWLELCKISEESVYNC